MADISDVEATLVAQVAAILGLGRNYVPGTTAASSVVMSQCRIYRGWGLPDSVAADMKAGIANISVFPVPGTGRKLTRYVPKWKALPKAAATLTISQAGPDFIFSGLPSASQVIGIRVGAGINPQTYAYRMLATDTPTTVATALAALVPGTSSNGNVLITNGLTNVSVSLSVDQPMIRETRRQDQHVWIIVWCPNPHLRDVVARTVDIGLGNLVTDLDTPTDQLPLQDGSTCILHYYSSHTDDQAQKAGIWRRDLRYVVEYPTIQTETWPLMVFGTVNDTNQTSGVTITTVIGPH